MEALVIKSNNRNDLKLIEELVKKMGLQFQALTAEEIEKLGLVHDTYEMSLPVLAEDWDRVEDDHWDDY
jgi:hypothetical protein